MPEPIVATIATDATATADVAATATATPMIGKPGQLMADACPEPTMTLDDFFAKAKTDGMPLNMPEPTMEARNPFLQHANKKHMTLNTTEACDHFSFWTTTSKRQEEAVIFFYVALRNANGLGTFFPWQTPEY